MALLGDRMGGDILLLHPGTIPDNCLCEKGDGERSSLLWNRQGRRSAIVGDNRDLYPGLGMNPAGQYVPPPEAAKGIMIAIGVAAVLIVLNMKATRLWFQKQINKIINRM